MVEVANVRKKPIPWSKGKHSDETITFCEGSKTGRASAVCLVSYEIQDLNQDE